MGGPGGKGNVAYSSGHGLGSGHGHMETVRRHGGGCPPPPPALPAFEPQARPASGASTGGAWGRWQPQDWDEESWQSHAWESRHGRSAATGSGDAWAPADWGSSPPPATPLTQADVDRTVQDALRRSWNW